MTELVLVNPRLLDLVDRDLSKLRRYSEAVAKAAHTLIPPSYPVIGRDAFRTATGVHAAAIVKAFKKDDHELADSVHSGMPSRMIGPEQVIEVGLMSGRSNVLYWLEKHGIPATDELVDRIYSAAKQSERVLTEDEILALVGSLARRAKSH